MEFSADCWTTTPELPTHMEVNVIAAARSGSAVEQAQLEVALGKKAEDLLAFFRKTLLFCMEAPCEKLWRIRLRMQTCDRGETIAVLRMWFGEPGGDGFGRAPQRVYVFYATGQVLVRGEGVTDGAVQLSWQGAFVHLLHAIISSGCGLTKALSRLGRIAQATDFDTALAAEILPLLDLYVKPFWGEHPHIMQAALRQFLEAVLPIRFREKVLDTCERAPLVSREPGIKGRNFDLIVLPWSERGKSCVIWIDCQTPLARVLVTLRPLLEAATHADPDVLQTAMYLERLENLFVHTSS